MKNLFLLISLLFGYVSAICAQEFDNKTIDILSVYTNDGGITMLLKSDVDSISLSYTDINNKKQDHYVTQEIFTPDSIYRFDLEMIDSIALQPLPTILKKDVIDLQKSEIRKYITGADTDLNHLFISSSIPENLLPKVGNKLVYDTLDDTLPLGFAGIIKKIGQNKNGYDIYCEHVNLEDLYDSYCKIIELESGYTLDNNATADRTRQSSTNNIDSRSIYPNNYWTFNQAFDDTFYIYDWKVDNGCDNSVELGSGTSQSLHHEIGLSSHVKCRIFQQFSLKDGSYTSVHWDSKHSLYNQLEYEGKVEFHPDDLNFLPRLQAPMAAGIRLGFEAGLFLSMDGTFGFNFKNSLDFEIIGNFSFSSANREVPQQPNLIIRPIPNDNPIDGFIYGKADLSFGLYAQINLSWLNRDLINVALRGEAGIQSTLDALIDNETLEDAATSPNLYKSLTSDNAIEIHPFTSGDLIISALADKIEICNLNLLRKDFNPIWKGSVLSSLSISQDPVSLEFLDISYPFKHSWGHGILNNKTIVLSKLLRMQVQYLITDITENTTNPDDDYFTRGDEWAQKNVSYWFFRPKQQFHTYKITPYCVLNFLPDYSNNETEERRYPIMTDIELNVKIPEQPKIEMTHSYMFGGVYVNGLYIQNQNMFNFKLDKPDLSQFEIDKEPEWGIFATGVLEHEHDRFLPAADIKKTSIGGFMTLGENGNDIRNADICLSSDNDYIISNSSLLVPFGEVSGSQIDFKYPYHIGYYIVINGNRIPISCQLEVPEKSYSLEYNHNVEWTQEYDRDGNLKSYKAKISEHYENYALWTSFRPNSEKIGLSSLNLSSEVLKTNKLRSSESLKRNSPVTFTRNDSKSLYDKTLIIANSIPYYNLHEPYNKLMRLSYIWEYTPPSSSPTITITNDFAIN